MSAAVPLHRIVLTGGPCAGKTTALARITERVESLGWRVFRVPEAATLLFSGGARPAHWDHDEQVRFQSLLLRLGAKLEETFVSAAKACGKPSIVLCDRGAMDSRAYVDETAWGEILSSNDWTTVALRDERYDAVIHLVTAADGAEAAYTTANNAVRDETPDQARALDARTLAAWVGHPHLRVIKNDGVDFDGKVRRATAAVCKVIGVPEPVESERKFLVKHVGGLPRPFTVAVEIEQTYLLGANDGSTERVRKRSQHGSSVYYHTIKRPLRAGERIEIERQVSAREYGEFMTRKDPARQTVSKIRTCFVWEGWYYELDVFRSPRYGLTVLEVELDPGYIGEPPFPPFIEIEREVTDEPGWSNAELAAVP